MSDNPNPNPAVAAPFLEKFAFLEDVASLLTRVMEGSGDGDQKAFLKMVTDLEKKFQSAHEVLNSLEGKDMGREEQERLLQSSLASLQTKKDFIAKYSNFALLNPTNAPATDNTETAEKTSMELS